MKTDNLRISARTQLSLQYAFKYVMTNFDGSEYSGYTDLVGLDFRRGFKNQWDWGAHTSIYHSYEAKVVDYGFALDVGFNVRDNMWVTLGTTSRASTTTTLRRRVTPPQACICRFPSRRTSTC